jgi:hypothetical protein
VPAGGVFDINIRSAAKETTGQLKILVNDAFTSGDILLPQTGENQAWKTSTVKGVKLSKGWNKLRVLASAGGFNLNYLQFISTDNTAKIN